MRPTRLNMKAKDSVPPRVNPLPAQKDLETLSAITPAAAASSVTRTARSEPSSKSLNVIFNYNGHSWDAYEVLGVPAGANIRIVTEAYQVAIRRCEKESVDFLETAYKAILNKK